MNTASSLLNKTFVPITSSNEKLSLLSNQMTQMNSDYEEMKRTREEAKKQLEAKFQDVYRKIQNTKDFVVSEGKRINDTLLAFQSKFDNKLKNLDDKFQEQHRQYAAEVDDRFNTTNKNLFDLDKRLEEEKNERIRQNTENLKEIKEKLTFLSEGLEKEKNTRESREKDIIQMLDDAKFFLEEKLDKEKTERILKSKELRDDLSYELKQHSKMNEEFHKKSIEEFGFIANNLEKEMNNRFEHQDKIVDNLSNVVRTIQDTMKLIGKDV